VTEVVCVGLATLDTILVVPRHPGPDDRVVATECVVAGGGPAATAAVALARQGVAVAFVGAVGDDDAGEQIHAGLAREGVDVSRLDVVAGARSPRSTILVGPDGGRTIVHVPGTAPLEVHDLPDAVWVHVDHHGYAAVRGRGLRLSVDAGNPVPALDLAEVALYAPTEEALLSAFSAQSTSRVPPGHPGGAREEPGRSPGGAAAAALAAGAGLVVVTRGAAGSAAYTRAGEEIVVPSPAVDAVSTLGAGDVFHGALLAQLVREAPLRDALAEANRIAAESCRALDGRSAIPFA
jgi:sugar/nucleoside kinase (ribokinase family)